MARYDVAVVGGGPIGAVAARHAAEQGARVLLVEQRRTPQEPAPCAGLITAKTLDILGASSSSVVGKIRGIDLEGPDAIKLSLRSDETKAVVVDRAALNRELLAHAEAAGVEILRPAQVTDFSNSRLVVRPSGQPECSVDVGILIGADGPRSRVAGWLGLRRPRVVFPACQVTLRAPHPHDVVTVTVGRDIAPEFFLWTVPGQDGNLRIGMAGPPGSNVVERLNRWIARRYAGHRVVERTAGAIPLSTVSPSAARYGLLVGDAAGQVKPISGGGLYTGGLCAEPAGRLAAQRALAKDSPSAVLSTYDAACDDLIGKELRFGQAIRRIIERMTDTEIHRLIESANHPELLSFLAETADIDQLHALPRTLMRHPGLLTHALGMIGSLFADEGVADSP